MYWGSTGNLPSIEMAFLDGSGHTTLFTESSANYTGITLFNNSLYISDSSRRYTNFLAVLKHAVHLFKERIDYVLMCNCINQIFTSNDDNRSELYLW